MYVLDTNSTQRAFMSEKYLTPKELSERWEGKISVKTLANWRCDPIGKGPKFRRFGNKILYPLSGVEAYERANHFGSTSEYKPTSSKSPPRRPIQIKSPDAPAPLTAGMGEASGSRKNHSDAAIVSKGVRRRREAFWRRMGGKLVGPRAEVPRIHSRRLLRG